MCLVDTSTSSVPELQAVIVAQAEALTGAEQVILAQRARTRVLEAAMRKHIADLRAWAWYDLPDGISSRMNKLAANLEAALAQEVEDESNG